MRAAVYSLYVLWNVFDQVYRSYGGSMTGMKSLNTGKVDRRGHHEADCQVHGITNHKERKSFR